MVFNSLEFFIFFGIVGTLYFILPHKVRWLLLLLASCIFYMAFVPKYIFILAFLIVVDYIAGLVIERSSGRRRLAFLGMSIFANVILLVFFKYYNFLSVNVGALSHAIGWNYSPHLLNIILPIGLSFHTFQAMSYTIEVYKGRQKAEQHFGIYALYVMFFPQLVAGPIERPQNLLHQFYEQHDFNYERVTNGLKLMAWGLFKKTVIADRLALVVNQVFGNSVKYSGPTYVIAIVFFAYQIYCDFSGYTDIALGCAQVLGFKLMQNFDRPYAATSLADFWRRWHISLSTWFKDYVYIPLGGNRVNILKWCRNILIVFLLSGLWHGASWTFVVWGGLHGVLLVASRLSEKWRQNFTRWIGLSRLPRLHKAVQVTLTFILVNLAWVFFRADTITQAWAILSRVPQGFSAIFTAAYFKGLAASLNIGRPDLILCFLVIMLLEAILTWQGGMDIREKISSQPVWLRWGIYYAIGLSLLFLAVQGGQQFIYFQF